jgi:histidinol-phosphate aminotransferase
VLQLLARGYAGPGDEVLHSRHGFLIYPIAALATGATPVVADETNLVASVDNLIAALTPRTRMVFLANPNNPTGTYIGDTEMRRLHRALPPDCLLVIDSAYAEFVDATDYAIGNAMVDEFANVVVTRTFSKIYGMGGMRLGWAYCPAPIADVLNRTRGPFNVSGPALAAGEAAVEDTDFLRMAYQHNLQWRAWLGEKLELNSLTVIPSVANFLLVRFADVTDAQAADAFLRSKGIIVRAVGAYGLPDCLRITIGREEEVRAAADALAEYRSL